MGLDAAMVASSIFLEFEVIASLTTQVLAKLVIMLIFHLFVLIHPGK